MCLMNAPKHVEKFLNTKRKRPYIVAYKILLLSSRQKPQLSSIHYDHIWKVGVNISNSRRRSTPCFTDIEIGNGIHVYLNRKEAESNVINGLIVPVRCYIKDLVGVNYYSQEAVFTKVTLTDKNFKKATKGW